MTRFCTSCGQWHSNDKSKKAHVFEKCDTPPIFPEQEDHLTLFSMWKGQTYYLLARATSVISDLSKRIVDMVFPSEEPTSFYISPLGRDVYCDEKSEISRYFNNLDFIRIIRKGYLENAFDKLVTGIRACLNNKKVSKMTKKNNGVPMVSPNLTESTPLLGNKGIPSRMYMDADKDVDGGLSS